MPSRLADRGRLRSLPQRLGPQGITVNLLHPATRTERTDAETERRTATNAIRRIVDAREIAQVVTFLASTKAANVSHRRGHRCQRRLDPRDVSVRRAIVFLKEMRAVAAEVPDASRGQGPERTRRTKPALGGVTSDWRR